MGTHLEQHKPMRPALRVECGGTARAFALGVMEEASNESSCDADCKDEMLTPGSLTAYLSDLVFFHRRRQAPCRARRKARLFSEAEWDEIVKTPALEIESSHAAAPEDGKTEHMPEVAVRAATSMGPCLTCKAPTASPTPRPSLYHTTSPLTSPPVPVQYQYDPNEISPGDRDHSSWFFTIAEIMAAEPSVELETKLKSVVV